MKTAFSLGATAFLIAVGGLRGAAYDPLAVDPNFKPQVRDMSVHDPARNRDIPIRIYLAATEKPEPVILFSHGLGGTRAGSKFLGEQWSARGYVAAFLQHPGSDDGVWKNEPPAERLAAMRGAISLENFLLRVRDVPAVEVVSEAMTLGGVATSLPLRWCYHAKEHAVRF